MFIKVHSNLYNSASVRRTYIERQLPDVDTNVSEWWLWAFMSDDTRVRWGIFSTRAEAEQIVDQYIYPKMMSGECVDLDALYETLHIRIH